MQSLPTGLLLLVLIRQLPKGVWWWRMLVLGTLNVGLFLALLFIAAYNLPGGVASTIGAVQPVVVALLAWLVLKQRPAVRTFGIMFVGLIGVGLLVLGPEAQLDLVGVAAVLAQTISWGGGIILIKYWGQPVPVLLFTAWQLTIGGLMLTALTWVVEGPLPNFTTPNIIGCIYEALILSLLCYCLWFRGVGRLPAATVGMLTLLSPIVASLLGLIILGQTLSLLQLLGAILILASIVVSTVLDNRKPG